jgi:hypothetical protein
LRALVLGLFLKTSSTLYSKRALGAYKGIPFN